MTNQSNSSTQNATSDGPIDQTTAALMLAVLVLVIQTPCISHHLTERLHRDVAAAAELFQSVSMDVVSVMVVVAAVVVLLVLVTNRIRVHPKGTGEKDM